MNRRSTPEVQAYIKTYLKLRKHKSTGHHFRIAINKYDYWIASPITAFVQGDNAVIISKKTGGKWVKVCEQCVRRKTEFVRERGYWNPPLERAHILNETDTGLVYAFRCRNSGTIGIFRFEVSWQKPQLLTYFNPDPSWEVIDRLVTQGISFTLRAGTFIDY